MALTALLRALLDAGFTWGFPQFYFRSWITGVALQWNYDVPVVYEVRCGFGDL
jgi:hypothetical protein